MCAVCEESLVVRKAFAARGWDAWSCDLLPRPGQHLRGDARDFDWSGFDLLICFPPCTYLCSSGLHRNKGNPERQRKTTEAVKFVSWLLGLASKHTRLALENPVGRISTSIAPPDQVTCLWLRGLPPLKPTKIMEPRWFCCGRPLPHGVGKYGCANCNGDRKPLMRWKNQTASGQNNASPGHRRARERSKTYPGIAAAMADQWTEYLTTPRGAGGEG